MLRTYQEQNIFLWIKRGVSSSAKTGYDLSMIYQKKIAYQGRPGSYSHAVVETLYPQMRPLACQTFEDAFEALDNDLVGKAVIPIDNSIAGRVADVHHLLPQYNVYITDEAFLPIRHCFMVNRDVALDNIKTVKSHVHALPQCRDFIAKHGFHTLVAADTAGAAEALAESGDQEIGVIASQLAAQIYGLDILAQDIQDAKDNTTRFLVFEKEPRLPEGFEDCLTSLVFAVKNEAASLHKALGCFAEGELNLIKLESYLSGAEFRVAQFYCEFQGHYESESVQSVLKALESYTDLIQWCGTYSQRLAR